LGKVILISSLVYGCSIKYFLANTNKKGGSIKPPRRYLAVYPLAR